ncbi:uncharacterized protein LOC119999156 [Tripterygium wilfordii]|uniref:uncharacterized protein LOC119999156 n=1 Tax=Tripterygium wilfordii TaxID=458696 RepID=UPI0018F82D6F|nr:uncharacterized protein LOC119999156 [Tripterygium wilfordii]
MDGELYKKIPEVDLLLRCLSQEESVKIMEKVYEGTNLCLLGSQSEFFGRAAPLSVFGRAAPLFIAFFFVARSGFMMDVVFLMVKYGDQVLPIKVSDDFNYNVLLRSIVDKWSCLDSNNFHLLYSIPAYTGCSLRNDEEFRTMISLISVLRLQLVEVVVTVDIGGLTGSVASVSNVNVHVNNFGDAETIDESEEVFSSRICSSSNSRPLLSSSWASFITHVGQGFDGGVADFRISLSKYSIERGFKFVYLRNNEERVDAHCANKYSEGCNWFVHGSLSKVNGVFYVRKLCNVHTCTVLLRRDTSLRMSSKLISGLIVDIVRSKPSLTPNDVVSHCLSSYGCIVSYDKAWGALEKAKAFIFGDSSESYKQLRWYVNATRSTNPRSHIVLELDEASKKFQHLFVGLSACIHGFSHCRPMLFLDGTFLKGRFKGILLSATGKNGNQGLFPLAFAVVDAENLVNWLWFLEQLRIVNLRDKFSRGAFSNKQRERMVWLFRECAHAPSVSILNDNLMKLKNEGGVIVDNFLADLPLKCWTNAYSVGCQYGEMYSNAAESFNAWILDCRDLPITQMVDKIRVKLMDWFYERNTESGSWSRVLCPKMVEKLQKYVDECRPWIIHRASDSKFEVVSDPPHGVDISSCKCSCGMWSLNGYPCVHAVKAISRCGRPIEEFVPYYFHVSAFRKSYEEPIHPIPASLSVDFKDENFEILPPVTKRQPGRPRKRRIRSRGEEVRRIRCGRCGKLGTHNRKSCKEPLA